MTRFPAVLFVASIYSGVAALSGDEVRTIRLGMDTNYLPYAMAGEHGDSLLDTSLDSLLGFAPFLLSPRLCNVNQFAR